MLHDDRDVCIPELGPWHAGEFARDRAFRTRFSVLASGSELSSEPSEVNRAKPKATPSALMNRRGRVPTDRLRSTRNGTSDVGLSLSVAL